jgi:hypothetical protein
MPANFNDRDDGDHGDWMEIFLQVSDVKVNTNSYVRCHVEETTMRKIRPDRNSLNSAIPQTAQAVATPLAFVSVLSTTPH